MKILTLNAHSLSEENQALKTKQTADFITANDVDIVFLQEVCQTIHEDPIASNGFYTGEENLRKDNYALALSECLAQLPGTYYWTWLPIKLGFGKFEEGVAVFARKKILQRENFTITREQDFGNWRKRAALGVRTEDGWFYTTHMGWWADAQEPFMEQLERLNAPIFAKEGRVFLGGDFNAPDFLENESYDALVKSGWIDTYTIAEETVGKFSAEGNIVGWQNSDLQKMRIDYIFVNEPVRVKKNCIVLDGKNGPVVSDHYGILVETE